MALFKSCCCCSLRTGTLIIGWLEIIGGVLGMVFAAIMMILMAGVNLDTSTTQFNGNKTISNRTTTIVEDSDAGPVVHMGKAEYALVFLILVGIFLYYICFTFLAVLLVIGVQKQNMRYIKTWVQIKSILLILAMFGIIIQIFLLLFDIDSSVTDELMVAVIDGLLILVVHSYYEQVNEISLPTY